LNIIDLQAPAPQGTAGFRTAMAEELKKQMPAGL